tara:strand:+ start:280 stop:1071 length:792 start_codon:yes stop_codon:yes gene_type:complete
MHRLFLAVLFSLYASAAVASYQSTRLVYTVSWGNILLAKSQLDYQFGEDDARILASVDSDGFIAFFSSFQSRAKADLVLKDAGWTPKTLFMERISGRKTVQSRVAWDDDSNVSTEMRMPELDLGEVYPLTAQMRVNVLDPYSAVLRLIRHIKTTGDCTESYEIFDGRRRNRLHFETLGTSNLTKTRPGEFAGEALVCSLEFEPIGGHQIDSKWRSDGKDDDDDRIKMFFGRPLKGQTVPVRVEVDSWIGAIVGRLDLRKMKVQ